MPLQRAPLASERRSFLIGSVVINPTADSAPAHQPGEASVFCKSDSGDGIALTGGSALCPENPVVRSQPPEAGVSKLTLYSIFMIVGSLATAGGANAVTPGKYVA